VLARAGPAFAPGWLEALSDFFRLREVFGRGAPEEQASGHFSDRHRNLGKIKQTGLNNHDKTLRLGY
jgi:hypothetical protein